MKLYCTDITENEDGLIIHGVNCQGVMGSGVALAIKTKWPAIYDRFLENGKGTVLLGSFDPCVINNDLTIGNCYTQEFYGRDGKQYANYNAIRNSVSLACEYAKKNDLVLRSPLIGCGLGGLEFERVLDIYRELELEYSIEILLYSI